MKKSKSNKTNGRKWSEEARGKHRLRMSGKNNPMYGKKRIVSEETRIQMRNSHIGKPSGAKGKKWSEEAKEKHRIRMSGENNPMHGKKRIVSEETKEKMKFGSRKTIEKIKVDHSLFSKIEEMRYNPDKLLEEKEIQVHCKYNKCDNSKEKGGWFTPTEIQMSERIRQIESFEGNGGSYFYCSEKCKRECILYNLRKDPYDNYDLSYTDYELQVWRQTVLEMDKSQCQICGSTEDLHVHHIIPKKLESCFALDPENGITLCKTCHYKYGHKDKSECSIKNIKNKNYGGC